MENPIGSKHCYVDWIDNLNEKVMFIPFGTIAYAKFKDGVIRQAKCVGMLCQPHEVFARGKWEKRSFGYKWKIAGLPNMWFGSYSNGMLYALDGSSFIHQCGNVYSTEEDAQFGDTDKKGGVLKMETCLFSKLYKAYGLDGWDNFYIRGNDVYLHAWKLKENGGLVLESVYFRFDVNENGLKLIVPDIDKGTHFATKQKAMASYKYKPIIGFDDEDKSQEEEYVNLNIKVKKSDVKRVKEFINDCIEFE